MNNITPIINTNQVAGTDNQPARIKKLVAQQEKQLKSVCLQFESLFIEMLMRQMRDSVPKGGFLDGGNAERLFKGMQDEQLAQEIGRRGAFKVGDILFQQMKSNISVPKGHALEEYEKQINIQGQRIKSLNRM